MVFCLFCEKEILNPRKEKGMVKQKFCSDRCRFDYHNREKKEFTKELMSLLKKYGYLK